MLSPGEFHRFVPKDREENLLYRKRLLEATMTDSFNKARIFEACKQDILFWINSFCFICEPRSRKTYPFVTWPFQDDGFRVILDCIDTGEDLVITKSRDMGVSWMCVAVMTWMWQFHKNSNFLMVSRKEDLVDKPGDPDSLFWKIDYILEYQPDWLRPQEYDRRFMHFGNKKTNTTIDGESTNSGAGVGGRRTALFLDEFSRMQNADEIMSGTADTTNCRIFNFTYWAPEHPSYDLGQNRPDLKHLKLKWDLHPQKRVGLYQWNDKTKKVDVLDQGFEYPIDFNFVQDGKLRSIWYDHEETRRANARDMALHVDMEPTAYGGQVFEHDMIMLYSNQFTCEPYWQGDIQYDPDDAIPSALEKSDWGPVKLWCVPDVNGRPPKAKYAAGADISQGGGATNSTFMLGNAETGEKVLEFVTNNMRPEAFAQKCVALCRWFCDDDDVGARFAWELHGPGVPFGDEVIRLGYHNYYHRTNELRNGFIGTNTGTKPGWSPNNDNKTALIEQYRTALSRRYLLNRSRASLEEALEFTYNDQGVPEHKETSAGGPTSKGRNHGDRVIADGLMWKMMEALGARRKLMAIKKNELPVGEVPYRSIAWYHRQEEIKHLTRGGW